MAVTILTGAGASKPLGYPTTDEFFSEAPPEQVKPHNQVFQALRNYLKTNKLDVEKVLEITEPVEKFVKTPPGKLLCQQISGSWHQQIINFTEWSRNRCFDLYGQAPDSPTVAKFYRPLLDTCGWENRRISLYTTNYDPVTDVLLELADNDSIPCYGGFGPQSRWKPENYRKDPTGLDIFRLHGSMCWIEKNNQIVNTYDYSRRATKVNHLLIYPGYKGNPEEDRQEVFSFPHKELRKDLKQSSVFIAIGFAFRDKHINDILKDALNANSKLSVLILNPVLPDRSFMTNLKDSLKKRFEHIADKFGEINLAEVLPKYLEQA